MLHLDIGSICNFRDAARRRALFIVINVGARLLVESTLQRFSWIDSKRQLDMAVWDQGAEPGEIFFQWRPFYVAEVPFYEQICSLNLKDTTLRRKGTSLL